MSRYRIGGSAALVLAALLLAWLARDGEWKTEGRPATSGDLGPGATEYATGLTRAARDGRLAAGADPWTTYGHDARRTFASEAGCVPGGLRTVWRHVPTLGGKSVRETYHALARPDAVFLYFMGIQSGFARASSIARLSPAGEPRWTTPVPGAVAPPNFLIATGRFGKYKVWGLIDENYVPSTTIAAALASRTLVVTGTGAVHVLALADGREIWKGKPEMADGRVREPVMVGSRVYLTDSPADMAKAGLLALDAEIASPEECPASGGAADAGGRLIRRDRRRGRRPGRRAGGRRRRRPRRDRRRRRCRGLWLPELGQTRSRRLGDRRRGRGSRRRSQVPAHGSQGLLIGGSRVHEVDLFACETGSRAPLDDRGRSRLRRSGPESVDGRRW